MSTFTETPQPAQITSVKYHKPVCYAARYYARALHGQTVINLEFSPELVYEFRAAGYEIESWVNIPKTRQLAEPMGVLTAFDGNGWSIVAILPFGSSDPAKARPINAPTKQATPLPVLTVEPLIPGALPKSVIVKTYTPADKNYNGEVKVISLTGVNGVRYAGASLSYPELREYLLSLGYRFQRDYFATDRRIYWGGKPMSRTKNHVYVRGEAVSELQSELLESEVV